jgi:hypothetical protein
MIGGLEAIESVVWQPISILRSSDFSSPRCFTPHSQHQEIPLLAELAFSQVLFDVQRFFVVQKFYDVVWKFFADPWRHAGDRKEGVAVMIIVVVISSSHGSTSLALGQ